MCATELSTKREKPSTLVADNKHSRQSTISALQLKRTRTIEWRPMRRATYKKVMQSNKAVRSGL